MCISRYFSEATKKTFSGTSQENFRCHFENDFDTSSFGEFESSCAKNDKVVHRITKYI